jgi:hypothetical protein
MSGLYLSAAQLVLNKILYYHCREDEEEEGSGATKSITITSFFKQVNSNKRQKTKHDFFRVRNLAVLESL